MECPRCGNNVFYLTVDLTLVVKEDVAYVDDIGGYISATCTKCGEWEINAGEVFETVKTIKFDYDEMRKVLEEARRGRHGE